MLPGDRRDRVDFRQGIERSDLGCLGDRDGGRLAGVNELRRKALDLGNQTSRIDLAELPIDGSQPRASGQIFRRAALIFKDVRFAMAEGDATRPRDRCQSQRIGGRAGRDKEHRDLALEYLVESLGDALVESAGAVSGIIAGRGVRQRLGNGRMHAGPVVGGKKHDGGLTLLKQNTDQQWLGPVGNAREHPIRGCAPRIANKSRQRHEPTARYRWRQR